MWDFTVEERKEFMDGLAGQIKSCDKCSLCSGRTKAVPGEGPMSAKIFIIGEAPGPDEDQSGRPFVGKPGSLLNQTLDQLRIPRSKVFLTNVVKCRPPQNRKPKDEEISACSSYLNRQLKTMEPKLILTLGSSATEFMVGSTGKKITAIIEEDEYFIRSSNDWKFCIVPAFHPSYLLRHKELIKPSTESLKTRISKALKDLKKS